eukprot:CAMPEP_0204117332 /NCGR_PEP_ID=MMETSP0361-20130328/5914_1 /ASSEMBLY_ACC=CAM_ASM_000343 /TAXON_ID=268821 /ORGANISM="Scrippsiella Hangoei, Strain SHTV-5" /LENGTH=116 /DNA_ID=CAMNT_0051068223 /DNA_START=286 /DNA_END=636 /DNA_ORIENTATION=-
MPASCFFLVSWMKAPKSSSSLLSALFHVTASVQSWNPLKSEMWIGKSQKLLMRAAPSDASKLWLAVILELCDSPCATMYLNRLTNERCSCLTVDLAAFESKSIVGRRMRSWISSEL